MSHLSTATLEIVAAGGPLTTGARAHVDECESCRTEIERLRAEFRSVTNYFAGAGGENPHDPPRAPADLVPGYQLLEEIGRGGQGVVYKATQERTKRTVAVKMLLHSSFASAKQRDRFGREVEIIAKLNHPAIVTIYDGALVRGGQYAYAMEYVEAGVPLDRWARAVAGAPHDLVRTKLELFAEVCEAIHYAHQCGVIHRDLKPSNILVDARGHPRLLDFGIAKLVGDLASNQTVTGELACTPAYASPEQLAGRPDDIDARTDVYSLGVILFEMLAGRMPHNIDGLPIGPMVHVISTTTATALGTVDRAFRGDLETIAAKAMDHDKTRRYQTAGALAEDIRRHLTGHTIHARQASAWYSFRKAAKRHKAAVLGAGIVLLTILIAGVVSIVFAVEARARAETLARQAYVGWIFAAQEALTAKDAGGVIENLKLADNQAASGLHGWEYEFLTAQLNQSDRLFWRRHNYVGDVDISADGRWAVALISGVCALTWDMEQVDPSFMWLDLRKDLPIVPCQHIAISPDGALVALADQENAVYVVTREPGPSQPVILHHPKGHGISDLMFTNDSRLVVTATATGTVRMWDAHTGKQLEKDLRRGSLEQGFASPGANSVAVTDDNSTLVAAFASGWIVVWNMSSGSVMWEARGDARATEVFFGAVGTDVDSVAISDDGALVASGHRDGIVRLWNGADGKPVGGLPGHRGRVRALQFVPKSHDLLTGADNGVVRRWNTESRSVERFYFGLAGSVSEIACTRVGPPRFLALAQWETRLWTLDAPEGVVTLDHDGKSVYGAAFSTSGSVIWTAARERALRAWDPISGRRLRELERAAVPESKLSSLFNQDISALSGVAVSATDGADIVATTREPGTTQLWKGIAPPAPLELPLELKINGAVPTVTRDGRYLLVSLGDKAAVGWDLSDLNSESLKATRRRIELPENKSQGEQFHGATISPDGKLIALLGSDGNVWCLDADHLDRVVGHHKSKVALTAGRSPLIMSFSPDGSLLALPEQQDIAVLRVPDCTRVGTCRGHTAPVNSARFSPDGSRIVSASMDTTVRLWDTRTFDRRLVLREHQQGVLDAVFSPDGLRLVSCGADGRALIWSSVPRTIDAPAIVPGH